MKVYNIHCILNKQTIKIYDLFQEQEKKIEDERIRTENILSGNPLISSQKSEFKVKRRSVGLHVRMKKIKGVVPRTTRQVVILVVCKKFLVVLMLP